jgi:hypothetical protein
MTVMKHAPEITDFINEKTLILGKEFTFFINKNLFRDNEGSIITTQVTLETQNDILS